MKKKNALLRFGTLAMLTIILASIPISSVFGAGTLPKFDSTWQTVVPGCLATDYYELYPYAAKSLKVGFTKYGELIGINPGDDYNVAANWVGLKYDGRDPFCNPAIPMNAWINGWLIEISYINPLANNPDRLVWAHAMFSDGTVGGDWGYDWTTITPYSTPCTTPGPSPHVGRKTNGVATTDPIKVLYHGPRRYIAELVTIIKDWEDADGDGVVDTGESWDLVKIVITIDFNKDTKEVLLLKDIKLLLPAKYLEGKVDIQFSEREEWDLGPANAYDSYVHMYDQSRDTCYGPEWHLVDKILRKYVETFTATAGQTVFTLSKSNVEPQSEKVWVNGVLKRKVTVGAEGPDYSINYTTSKITFTTPLKAGDVVKVAYKAKYIDFDHKYDIIQVISSDIKYVGWEAMWPALSDWTVDGWSMRTTPLINVQVDDAAVEPKIPFTIKEWDFMLGLDDTTTTDKVEGPPQYRVVEVKGLTDVHNADDEARGYGHSNVLDREVLYQLDQVFMPSDLYDAVYKSTKRYVKYFTGTGTTLTEGASKSTPVVFVDDAEWDQYCKFSERVIRNPTTTPTLMHRIDNDPVKGASHDYHMSLEPATGIATISGLPEGSYKVLYSTSGGGGYEWNIVGRDSQAVDSAGAVMVSEWFYSNNIPTRVSGLDMQDAKYGPKVPYVFKQLDSTLLPDRTAYRGITPDPTRVWGPNTGRSALLNDWCTKVPIQSSNIIGVGGFYANQFTEYMNDFTGARFNPTTAKIEVGPGCWSWTNAYKPDDPNGDGKYDDQTYGYAVIATYKDLDGTLGFVIWGWTGQDTYFATYHLWKGDLGTDLRALDYCVTAIIIKIDYTGTCPYKYTKVEILGTISETPIPDYIHFDP